LNGEFLFQIIFLILFLASVIVRGYSARKGLSKGEKRSPRQRWKETIENEGKLLSGLLVLEGLVMLTAFILYLFFLSWIPWSMLPIPDWIRWIGFGVGILSLPFLVWVHQVLGKQFAPSVEFQADHQLVTTGPYSRVRHPMYTVHIVLFFTWIMVSANLLFLINYIVMLIIIILRMPKEEAKLLEIFGEEYRSYMKRTGRLLPRFCPNTERN